MTNRFDESFNGVRMSPLIKANPETSLKSTSHNRSSETTVFSSPMNVEMKPVLEHHDLCDSAFLQTKVHTGQRVNRC